MQLLMIGTRDTALIPTHNTKIFIVWTFQYYLTTYAALHVALLLDTLHCPRWNNYVILVSRYVLFYSFRIIDVPLTYQLSHMSSQTMTNTMMHEWGPRVYLSIVGVAIPTTTSCNIMEYYPVRAIIIFLITLSWAQRLITLPRPYRIHVFICLVVKRSSNGNTWTMRKYR